MILLRYEHFILKLLLRSSACMNSHVVDHIHTRRTVGRREGGRVGGWERRKERGRDLLVVCRRFIVRIKC